LKTIGVSGLGSTRCFGAVGAVPRMNRPTEVPMRWRTRLLIAAILTILEYAVAVGLVRVFPDAETSSNSILREAFPGLAFVVVVIAAPLVTLLFSRAVSLDARHCSWLLSAPIGLAYLLCWKLSDHFAGEIEYGSMPTAVWWTTFGMVVFVAALLGSFIKPIGGRSRLRS
jgi:hypothetical protein